MEVAGHIGEGELQGAATQVAFWQVSPAPQPWPQLPQFWVSVERSTQRSTSGQQTRPAAHGALHVPPLVPPLELPPPVPPQLGQTQALHWWGTATSVHGEGQKMGWAEQAKKPH